MVMPSKNKENLKESGARESRDPHSKSNSSSETTPELLILGDSLTSKSKDSRDFPHM